MYLMRGEDNRDEDYSGRLTPSFQEFCEMRDHQIHITRTVMMMRKGMRNEDAFKPILDE